LLSFSRRPVFGSAWRSRRRASPALLQGKFGSKGWMARQLEMLSGCGGVLTPLEQAHARRLRREDEACGCIAGHWELRMHLAAALDCDPIHLQFGAEPNGKPFLLPNSRSVRLPDCAL